MDKIEVTVGIDIGGTNAAFGFVDKKGNCIASTSIPTKIEDHPLKGTFAVENLFQRIFSEIDKIFSSFQDNYKLIGIGIGAPNANYYKGTVEYPPNLNWGYVNVLEIVKKFSSLPSAITNDANAAAIGEMQFGVAKGMKDFIVITLGTGLGSGIVSNGQLIYGHDGFAGEIGHTIYDINGRQCGCGRKGCLETYASSPGICRTVFELLAQSNKPSELRNYSYHNLTSKIIYDAALNSDKIAIEAFDYTGKVLGIKLADAVAHTSPEAIILFGGLANAGDLIFNPTKKYMEENLLDIFKNKVKILPSALSGGKSAILGAAALIWNELSKK
ncbi:MAG: ROK family protein [Ignavibacterium sp.]